MATASQHRTKADKNRQFLTLIPVADHPEWSATVAFYIAVHLVEQVRAVAGEGHSTKHSDRLQYVQDRLRPIHDPFSQLYNVSRLARYESASNFFNRFSVEDVADRIIGGWLADVTTWVDASVAVHHTAGK